MATTYGLNCWKMLNHESAKLSIIWTISVTESPVNTDMEMGDE